MDNVEKDGIVTENEHSLQKQCRRFLLTINNPKETDEEFEKYIQQLEHFKYSIFQREKGHETGTEHFQVFIIFTIAKRFSTIKSYFPTAHIEPCKGSNVQCRDYCRKNDTRISGPYEIGQFVEERSRTDISNFIELCQLGASDVELAKLYPALYLKSLDKISKIRQAYVGNEFLNKLRDVEVTYIYGQPRTGKTRYIYDTYKMNSFYHVSVYNNSTFDSYNGEDILVLDEYSGQFKLELMNRLLDRYPFELPARFNNKVACYTKVYIISNYKITDIYKNEQLNNSVVYNAFNQRVKKIIRFDKTGDMIIERDNFVDFYRTDFIKMTRAQKEYEQQVIDDIF